MDDLTKNQEKVLVFLYEHKDNAEAPSVEQIAKGTGLTESVARTTLHELQAAGMVGGPPDLLTGAMKLLKQMDDGLLPTAAGYAEHVVLLASFLAKSADESFLASELGYDPDFVSTVGARLRASGIWRGAKLAEDRERAWMEDDGGISFFLDAAVAKGDLMITGGTPENREYQMTPGSKRTIADLLKRGG